MKRGLWILAAALLAGLAGFALSRQHCCTVLINPPPSSHHTDSRLPELEWLRREFKLTNPQFAEVSALHLAYRPACEALCMRVMTSHDKIKKLVDHGTEVSPEITAALQEHASLQVECQTAMLKHLYQTAACLSPEQARNYLDAMLPQIIGMTMEPEPAHRGH